MNDFRSINLESAVETRTIAHLLDSPNYLKERLFTNKVTARSFNTLIKSDRCTLASRPTTESRIKRAQQGFTLIEILIAIAIFALIGLASNQVLFSVLTSDEVSQQALQRIKQVQRSYQLIQTDIMQIAQRSVRLGGGEPTKQMLLAGDGVIDSEDQGIAFTRLGWRNPAQMFPRSTVQAVGYRLAENRLERLHYLYPDQESGTEPQVTVLLSDVEGLKFEFFDQKKWQKSWQKPTIPAGIAVIIKLKSYGELRWQFLATESSQEARN